jgi:hypothetical protein
MQYQSVFKYLFICCLITSLLPVSIPAEEYNQRLVDFSREDGPYTNELVQEDFGNGTFAGGNDNIEIIDGTAQVTFMEGTKVSNTGIICNPQITPAMQYTLRYRIKYDENFESGLHGKQFGLSGGQGYTGGYGEACRTNGDGWSARLQFDSHDEDITNQMYIYHSEMTGTYGESLGTNNIRYSLQRGTWHTITLRVTMQSDPSQKDGRIEVWCDDDKKFDLDDVKFVFKEEGRNINRVRLEAFPGGGGDTPTRVNYFQVDDFQWFEVEPVSVNCPSLPAFQSASGRYTAENIADYLRQNRVETLFPVFSIIGKVIHVDGPAGSNAGYAIILRSKTGFLKSREK